MKKATKPNPTKIMSAKAKGKVKIKGLAPEISDDGEMLEDESMATAASNFDAKRKYIFTVLAVVIIAGLALFKFSYLIVPAKVGKQPIFIWQYIGYMHQTYGKEAMDGLTTQAIINQEIAKSGVTVKSEDIQKQIDLLDQQASSSGGISAMLAAQQMTMGQLKDQIRIQLAVKQILKEKIAVTDQEVNDAYTKNRDLFKGVPEADAKKQIRSQLENQKFQTAAGTWLADVRKNNQVTIFFPGLK